VTPIGFIDLAAVRNAHSVALHLDRDLRCRTAGGAPPWSDRESKRALVRHAATMSGDPPFNKWTCTVEDRCLCTSLAAFHSRKQKLI
jgi:hypothetical protein